MRALLVQQDLQEALKGEKMSSFSIETDKEKVHKEILQKARSALILSLGDKILRKVTNKDTIASIWLKLENLYMTKSLANRLHKKTHIYTFKMSPGTHIEVMNLTRLFLILLILISKIRRRTWPSFC